MHICSRILLRIPAKPLNITFFSSKSHLALSYRSHGEPLDVLELIKETSTSGLPSTGQIHVRLLAAPINPSDINQIQGKYPLLHKLPCVGGNEVVGEVIAICKTISDKSSNRLNVGDWVIPSKAGRGGAWRQGPIESQPEEWIPLPTGFDLPSAATLSVTISTAYRMLKDFKTLTPGKDCIIQNGANSAVGRAVIMLARANGIASVNIIRRNPTRETSDEDLKAELSALGGDVVVFEDELRELNSSSPSNVSWPPVLGLNCIGGSSALSITKVLAQQGTLVTYGGMSMEPLKIPTGLLIFNDLTCKGFWMTRWSNSSSIESRQDMFRELARHVGNGELKSKVEFFDLENWRDAFGNMGGGKAVLKLSKPSRSKS